MCEYPRRAKILGHASYPSPALRAPSDLGGEGWGEGSVCMRKPPCLEIKAQSYTTPPRRGESPGVGRPAPQPAVGAQKVRSPVHAPRKITFAFRRETGRLGAA